METSHQKDEAEELNYNDRMDGYGFGPSESMDNKLPYEKERRKFPDVGHDQYGLRNQYGPVDQYSFRDIYDRRWSPSIKFYEVHDDWREWDRQRYDNDDYTRYAAPDYRENHTHDELNKSEKYRRSDENLQEEVWRTLMKSPDVDETNLNVTVKDGFVIIKGEMPDRQGKHFAKRLIEGVPGVSGVQDLTAISGQG